MFELSILVCAQNEAAVLERCLTSLHSVLLNDAINAEVVIVDNGSDDGTVDLAVKLSARLPELHMRVIERVYENGGYGSLVRYGLAHASGRYCALVAPDGSDPVDLIPKMVAELRKGSQLVICSRYEENAQHVSVARRYRVYQTVYRQARAFHLTGPTLVDDLLSRDVPQVGVPSWAGGTRSQEAWEAASLGSARRSARGSALVRGQLRVRAPGRREAPDCATCVG